MAQLQITFTEVSNLISNKFIVYLLDINNQPIAGFTQNQQIITNGNTAPITLNVNIPDGHYSLPVVKARVYSDNILSNVYTDIIYNNFIIDCDGVSTSTTTVQTSTTIPNSSSTSSTTYVQTTINTTVGQSPCLCNGSPTFAIFPVNGENIQFVSAIPITETVNSQTTTGTHRVTYNSCGVSKIIWGVYNSSGVQVKYGQLNVGANNFLVDLSSLLVNGGTFVFVLTSVVENGVGCSGVDQKIFGIAAQTTVTSTTIQQTTVGSDINTFAGPVQTYTGTININSHQQNTAKMNIGIASFTNNKAVLNDTFTETLPSGYFDAYQINQSWYTGNIGSYSFDPAIPLDIKKYRIPNGTNKDNWANYGPFAYSLIIID